MTDQPVLITGQVFSFRDYMPEDRWLVTHVSECAASVERILKTPRLVEIKDPEGVVIRSFLAKTSGDRMNISPRSHVNLVTPDEVGS